MFITETVTQGSGACLPILVKEIAKNREEQTVMMNTLKALVEKLANLGNS